MGLRRVIRVPHLVQGLTSQDLCYRFIRNDNCRGGPMCPPTIHAYDCITSPKHSGKGPHRANGILTLCSPFWY